MVVNGPMSMLHAQICDLSSLAHAFVWLQEMTPTTQKRLHSYRVSLCSINEAIQMIRNTSKCLGGTRLILNSKIVIYCAGHTAERMVSRWDHTTRKQRL